MTTQWDLISWSEPPQPEGVALGERFPIILGEVASLRDIHFSGDQLFLLIREIFLQQTDGSWITTEGLLGEGIHSPEWNLHI